MNIDTTTKSPNHEPRTQPIDMLVLHATAGSYDSALSWLCNNKVALKKRVSSHYLVREDGYTNQLVDESLVAWHAGESTWQGRRYCNAFSVGIEIVNDNTGFDPYPEVQYQVVLSLSRAIVARHKIPRSRVVRHLDISPGRKTDPAGFPWSRFLGDLFPNVSGLDRYRTRALSYVRKLPSTRAAQVGTLVKGEEVPVRRVVDGQFWQNTMGSGSYWAEIDAGFVWLPQLEKVVGNG